MNNKDKKYAKVLGIEIGMHPVAWMILATASFAVMGAFVKGLRRLPAYEVAFFRSFVNVLVLLPWLIRKQTPVDWRKDYKPLLIRGVSGCFSMLLYFFAIEHMNLADAVILNYSSPIPTLLLSAYILGDRLNGKSIACILVAFVGVALVIKPDFAFMRAQTQSDPAIFWAPIAGFLSAFVAAIAYVSIKMATRSLPPRFIVLTFAGVSSLITIIPTLLFYTQPTGHEWFLLIACGLVASLAQGSMTKAYAGLAASVASPLQLATALFSAIIGWLVWQETPDARTVLGAFFIIVGLIGAYALRPKQAHPL